MRIYMKCDMTSTLLKAGKEGQRLEVMGGLYVEGVSSCVKCKGALDNMA